MGTIGARFGRNVPLDAHLSRAAPRPARPEPARSSAASCSHATTSCPRRRERPRRRLAPVRGARLVQPRQERARGAVRGRARPTTIRGTSGRCGSRARAATRHPDANGAPPTFVTADSHWWDGSQIYGSEPAFAAALRRRRAASSGSTRTACCRATSSEHVDLTRRRRQLLARPRRSCTRSSRSSTTRSATGSRRSIRLDGRRALRQGAPVNAALMAKIHTVEWTPAIIAHPTTKFGDARELVRDPRQAPRASGRSNEVLSGIPGSPTNHHGVPYSLTEEFVAVYRMHPLLPDDFTFRSLETDAVLQERTFRGDRRPRHARPARRARLGDALYSFGIAHPGAITLHNYPRFLQELRASRTARRRPRGDRRPARSASAASRATTTSAGSST